MRQANCSPRPQGVHSLAAGGAGWGWGVSAQANRQLQQGWCSLLVGTGAQGRHLPQPGEGWWVESGGEQQQAKS